MVDEVTTPDAPEEKGGIVTPDDGTQELPSQEGAEGSEL